MYIAEVFHQWRLRRQQLAGEALAPARLPATVYALGATSLLTDVSTEMVAGILPVYLMVALRLSPAEYGVIDGLFRGGAAIVALLLGGLLGYGSGRVKLVAGLGYAFSAVTKVLLLASTTFAAVTASLVLDRLGKGARVAPRDALLAASVPPAQLGLAFGVHRAMDGGGALAGPLLAALVLWHVPNGYPLIFTLALLASLAGLLVFGGLVRVPAVALAPPAAPGQAWRARIAQCLPAPARRLVGCAMLLSLFTVSEGMLYAYMQRSFDLAPHIQPLLPVAAATVFLLAAAPLGWLADRAGALRVYGAAHLLLLALYGVLAATSGELGSVWLAAALAALLGSFLAATDGVLMAAVAAAVPAGARVLGLAVAGAGIAAAKLFSSSVFGWLWDRYDLPWALAVYGAGMLGGLLLCWRLLARHPLSRPDRDPP
jgi:MFS family permease